MPGSGVDAPRPKSAAWTALSRFAATVAIGLLVGLAVTGTMKTTSDIGNPRHAFSTDEVTISDDDAASALFEAGNLGPGKPITNCISVSFDGNGSPAVVRLRGQSSGALDRHLALTIEIGSGGRYNQCGTFRGDVLYHGSLAGFVAGHGSLGSGLTTFSPTGDDSRTFRFTVAVTDDAAAQGTSAKAGFSWDAQPAPAVVPLPEGTAPAPASPRPGSPTSAAPASPAPVTAPGTSRPGTATPPAPGAPRRGPGAAGGRAGDAVGPVPTPEPAAPSPTPEPATGQPAGAPTAGGGQDPAGSGGSGKASGGRGAKPSTTWETLQQFLGDALQVALAVGKGAAPPFLLLGIVALFLAFQDRVDRKDPKLALAPVHAEPHLTFAPRGEIRP